ncbi:uncharacterized protein LTR77_002856 [Saxophila tyrrhenica]|uniref:Beta-lactamase-related domain-containing protein n=1 Tax=Saxophila tyrrhenica TaxID=1690608 RepID=A0AAV9PGD0_9PEZI|nr:hypothetical protein LTR77_002856 [Saxophila tyrrhenica]
MRPMTRGLLFAACLDVAAALQTACPVRGQQYLPPTGLSNEPKFKSVAEELADTLERKVEAKLYDGLTFSASIFSTCSDDLLWQYHHSSKGLKNSTQGAKKVDADSIYRIGSISKLLTIYLWLLEDGDRHFNVPITDYLPTLTEYAAESSGLTSTWTDITIGDLAGQMAGLSRDYGLADLAIPNNSLLPVAPAIAKAFSDVPGGEIPTCGFVYKNGTLAVCTPDEYLKGVAMEAPIFSTAYTPVYSNEAYALIGLALEKITGVPFEASFNKSLVDALGLSSTYYTTPSAVSDQDVIPGRSDLVGWDGEFGAFAPAGGFYSSSNDFATMGKAILSNKLLTKAVTDRWFKPTSFVEDYAQGVGRPWEIFRRKVNGASVEVYVKGGDWGVYHTFFALVPTYDIGFTVLTADDVGAAVDGLHDPSTGIPNIVIDKVLAAVDDIAKEQALRNFGGHYADTSSNSSLTLDTDATDTGLLVTSWISNGADLYEWLGKLQPKLVYRIMPNQLPAGNDKVAFTSFYWSRAPPVNGTWYWECPTWIDVDEVTLGNVPLGQMVFNVGDDGKATSVEMRALRETLKRQS